MPLCGHSNFVCLKILTCLLQGKAGEDELVPVGQLADSDARDRDLLLPLAAEVVAEAGSVLVFCASRKQCQSCAELLADLLPGHIPAIAEVQYFYLQQIP